MVCDRTSNTKHELLYALQYDSVHGRYEGSVEDTKDGIKIDGHHIKIFSQMCV